jgi:hypothetical protein
MLDTGWAEDLRALGGDYFFRLNRYVFLAVREGSHAQTSLKRLRQPL